jgi:hypothetical protein
VSPADLADFLPQAADISFAVPRVTIERRAKNAIGATRRRVNHHDGPNMAACSFACVGQLPPMNRSGCGLVGRGGKPQLVHDLLIHLAETVDERALQRKDQ